VSPAVGVGQRRTLAGPALSSRGPKTGSRTAASCSTERRSPGQPRSLPQTARSTTQHPRFDGSRSPSRRNRSWTTAMNQSRIAPVGSAMLPLTALLGRNIFLNWGTVRIFHLRHHEKFSGCHGFWELIRIIKLFPWIRFWLPWILGISWQVNKRCFHGFWELAGQ
jgi:hypothetical protein